jgi:hypothetical protein
MAFKPTIGEEFPLNAELLKARRGLPEEITRSYLTAAALVVQLELPPTSMARLRTLREKTEAGSYAEVLKNALPLYEALIEEAAQGNDLIIRVGRTVSRSR